MTTRLIPSVSVYVLKATNPMRYANNDPGGTTDEGEQPPLLDVDPNHTRRQRVLVDRAPDVAGRESIEIAQGEHDEYKADDGDDEQRARAPEVPAAQFHVRRIEARLLTLVVLSPEGEDLLERERRQN